MYDPISAQFFLVDTIKIRQWNMNLYNLYAHCLVVLFIHFFIVLTIVLGNIGNIFKNPGKGFYSFCVWLTAIALWFTLIERPLQFTYNTILFNRAEVATSVDNLAIKFEL